MTTFFELFIVGITVSFGPCMAFCSPLILPYIAGTRKNWKEGLSTILIFSFTRLFIYVFLGLLSGILGRFLIAWLNQYSTFLFLAGGLFICLVGLLIVFGQDYKSGLCSFLKSQFIDSRLRGPIILAFAVSLLPCLPIIGMLAYIALKAQNLWQGAIFGLAFGLGKFLSPLIPLGILASFVPSMLIKNMRIYNFFNRLCGVILSMLGMGLIISCLMK
ncbi:TPA: hypothetical protein DCX16_02620 [bacterium]|nr:hypothetical protein [bacterium]